MSAIAGILGRVSDEENRSALGRMLGAMRHRGPAGEKIWTSAGDEAGNGCLLGYRGVATLDDSPQPVSVDGKTLVADASIFTHPRAGDVLNELAAASPIAALALFRGPFALAMWDDSSRQLLLARDPLGHRPLYLCENPQRGGWRLAFASEVRALLASGLLGAAPELDDVGVASLVWNGFVMSPHTIVRGIKALMPGECRIGEMSELFWTMPRPGEVSDDEASIRRELREAVRLNLQTRPAVEVGVLLSGGIDSSSVVNLAQQQAGRRIRTFCMAMEDATLDESAAARQFAAAIGSEHTEVRLTEEKFVAALDDAIASLDQPTFDALNQYQICRALAEAGIAVAVGGIGGDAIFGGDKTFRQLPRLRRIAALTGWTPEFLRVAAAKGVASLMQLGKPQSPIGSQQNWAKLPDVVRANGDLLALYQITYALFRPDFQEQLLAKGAETSYGLPRSTHDWLCREISGHTPADVAGILETRCFVGERLLRDADSVSSSLSIELRSPLADPRIIEALARLPIDKKYHPVGYKPLLRKYGLEGVNPQLYDRPKKGFVLPFDRWIRKNLGRVMNDVMMDSRLCEAAHLRPEGVARLWEAFQQGASGLYWTRVWAIYVLLRWVDRHGLRK